MLFLSVCLSMALITLLIIHLSVPHEPNQRPVGNVGVTRVQFEGSYDDNGLQFVDLLLERSVVEDFRSDFSQGGVVG